jgi:hypothetical protein
METYTIYKIYYGDDCVYLGRTKQPISTRLHGHFFKTPMIKVIDINQVNRIELCSCRTEADMFLYEIYYINKLKPTLNRDDKSKSLLTVSLPELTFIEYSPKKMDSWKALILKNDIGWKQKLQEDKEKKESFRQARNEARKILNKEEYENWLDVNLN